jgi:YfiH family protein
MPLDGALPVAWDAPVDALMSTRAGGVSAPPWDRLNLGVAVGDDPAAVAENRRRFAAALGATPVWLRQVHGTEVLRLGDGADPDRRADAAWTDRPGLACTVQVADCLPVLLAHRDGRAVAAAHAGWRGLAGGVLENTVRAVCAGIGCDAQDLLAWLGPGIGPSRFEVGADVLEAFADSPQHFVSRPRPDGAARWLADLPALARARLHRVGVVQVAGGNWCTVEDASRFFSFRRDGVTGRMAAAVACRPR